MGRLNDPRFVVFKHLNGEEADWSSDLTRLGPVAQRLLNPKIARFRLPHVNYACVCSPKPRDASAMHAEGLQSAMRAEGFLWPCAGVKRIDNSKQ